MNVQDNDEFVPIPDRAIIHLFVKITNETGLCKVLSSPILLYGATRISYSRGNKAIYSILGRVRNHHNMIRINSTLVKSISDDYNKIGNEYCLI
jgi:hypothetical protein